MSDWREQEATNQTIFREMNEWSEQANDERLGVGPRIDAYLCECSDRRCTEPILLSRVEYESIRAEPVRFAIALNHENPEIDRIVEENERFATVDKFHGVPARIARKTYASRWRPVPTSTSSRSDRDQLGSRSLSPGVPPAVP